MNVFRKPPSLWSSLLLLLLIGVGILVVLVLASDQMCYNDVVSRQPLYPGATIVAEDYSFLRARGMGTTHLTLQTSDAPDTVNEWKRQMNLELLRTNRFSGLATLDWSVQPNPDGAGSLFMYSSSCGE